MQYLYTMEDYRLKGPPLTQCGELQRIAIAARICPIEMCDVLKSRTTIADPINIRSNTMHISANVGSLNQCKSQHIRNFDCIAACA